MSTYTITKTFEFCASHQLDPLVLPEGHQCARLHGHNYVVTVELAAEDLDVFGFVLDYGELSTVKRFIDERLDHRHLNDVLPFNPTSELFARWLFTQIDELVPTGQVQLTAVTVSETPKTTATFRP